MMAAGRRREGIGAGAGGAVGAARGCAAPGEPGGYNRDMHLQVTRSVAADVETAWAVLSDVEHWPSWTRSMSSITLHGPLEVGTRATIRQPRMPVLEWRVVEVEPGRSFAWENELSGIRTVAHHEVAPAVAGTSTLTLTIDLAGPLAGPARLLVGRRTRRYLRMEADGLAAAAAAR